VTIHEVTIDVYRRPLSPATENGPEWTTPLVESAPIQVDVPSDDHRTITAAALATLTAPAGSPLFAAGHLWVPLGDSIEIIPLGEIVSFTVNIYRPTDSDPALTP
jgi:hypothetical protein